VEYGVVGDDTADDTVALQAALDACASIYIPEGFICKITATLTPSATCKRISGPGAIKTYFNGAAITANRPTQNNLTIDGIEFIGTNTGTSEKAIDMVGSAEASDILSCPYGVTIQNCYFHGFTQGTIISISNSDYRNHPGSLITGNKFRSSASGILFGTRAEYFMVTNNLFELLITQAISIISSNVTVENNSIVNCYDGIVMGTGDNDSHGLIIGNLINHNTNRPLVIDNINGRQLIIGNQFLGNSAGISVSNCVVNPIKFFGNFYDKAITLSGNTCTITHDGLEEGVWTGVVSGATTPGTYETKAQTKNKYAKVGREVTLYLNLELDTVSGGGSGGLRLTGIPYPKIDYLYPVGEAMLSGIAHTNPLRLLFITASATSTLYIVEYTNGAWTPIDISAVGSGDAIYGTIKYIATT